MPLPYLGITTFTALLVISAIWTLLPQSLNVSWCAALWLVWLGYQGRTGRKSAVPFPDEWHSWQGGWWCARGRWRRSAKGNVWQNSDEGPEPRGRSDPPSCMSGHGLPPACSFLPHHPRLVAGWLQGRSDPSENKPTKKRKISCPTSLLIQLHSSCTAAKSDARATRDVQGPGKGREQGSVTAPVPGKAAAAGTSYRSIIWKPYPSFVWAKFPEPVLLATADSARWKAHWGMLMLSQQRHVLCPVSHPMWQGWEGCDQTAVTQLAMLLKVLDMHVNSMLRF